jgi:GNAT superfamily N-acetyltransferase
VTVGAVVIRPAEVGDATRMVELVNRCFEEYRQFAPAGWEPPNHEGAVERVERGLSHEGSGIVAEANGAHVAHAMWIPASSASNYDCGDPGTAYLSQMFVAPEHRGTGLAAELLAAAVEDARSFRYREMRLLTPAGQARARAFYAREGWAELGNWGIHPELRLPLVECRRRL